MNPETLGLPNENERLQQDTVNLLFSSVFPRMSNLVILNFAYFCVSARTDADVQFRQALDQELFRRGLLTGPDFCSANVNVDKFSDDDMSSVDMWFAGEGDPDGYTHEDHYVKLLTGRDRWAERKRRRGAGKKAAQNQTKS